jgi:hypothetical protein
MAIKECCSLDYSRMGIEVYEPKRKEGLSGKTRFHKITKGGKVRWIYIHEPSKQYVLAREQYLKEVHTGCVHIRIGDWRMRQRREEEAFENRCAILAARLINFICKR